MIIQGAGEVIKKVCILPIILWLVLSAPLLSAAEEGIRITELAVTTKIVKGNPIDLVHRISSSSVKNLYCFTRITAPTGTETTIKHVWYNGTDRVGEYTLPVRGEKWRTYSKKSIERGSAGDWRVEVVDAGGKLLKTVKFRMN